MKSQEAANPHVSPGGLVTVAYLKARLDEGLDHLGIFMPLILDVIPGLAEKRFTVSAVQEAVASVHGVVMPQETIATLLKRAARRRIVVREAGRFIITDVNALKTSDVRQKKEQLQLAQLRLGTAMKKHASRRSMDLVSEQEALDAVLRFLEDQQIPVLLGAPPEAERPQRMARKESAVVAEFLYDVVENDPALTSVLRGVLEGLVLYHAAFIPDLANVKRRVSNLTAVFDSVLVRRALGYEGEGPRLLVRETIELLRSNGVRCAVFDKSVSEIERILHMYEVKLATLMGRNSLRAVPMARHFLAKRYSPGDVRQMLALLDKEIRGAGFQVIHVPKRQWEFTHGEAKLAERLADPRTQDTDEPRVLHDVDCVAGILQLRRGHRAHRVEDARAVFVTTAYMVIRNTRLWWELDEEEMGLPPIIHVGALANLLWLKRPTASPEYHVRELIALCGAAMRPSEKTWNRFLEHLRRLQESDRLSDDEVTAVIVSAMSDDLLREAELDVGDPEDIDAKTLDEVVDRVMGEYRARAEQEAHDASEEYGRRIAQIEERAREQTATAQEAAANLAEELRRRDLGLDARASKWAAGISGFLYWLMISVVVIGAALVAFAYPFGSDWVGLLLGLAVLVFMVLQVFGVLTQLRSVRRIVEGRFRRRIRRWLAGMDYGKGEG